MHCDAAGNFRPRVYDGWPALQVAAAAAAAAAPPDVWQVATLSSLKGGAAATAAWLLLKLLHQDVVATPVDVSASMETVPRTCRYPRGMTWHPRIVVVYCMRSTFKIIVTSCVPAFVAVCSADMAATGRAAAGRGAAAAPPAGHPAPAVCSGCDGAAQAGTPAASTNSSIVHCTLRWRGCRCDAQGPGRRACAGSRCSALQHWQSHPMPCRDIWTKHSR